MNKNSSINEIFQFIKKHNSFIILGHQSIDGDALGSVLSFQDFLENLSKKATVVYPNNINTTYSYMSGFNKISKNTDIIEQVDAVIVLDTANKERIAVSYDKYLKNKPLLNIDHHISNKYFAQLNYIINASSTGEVLFYLISELAILFGNQLDESFSRYDEMLSAIYDDTSGLRYTNVTLKTIQAVYELVRFGASSSEVSEKLFFSTSKSKAKLIAKVSSSLQFKHNDKLAFVIVTQKDLKETGATVLDTDGLVDIAKNIDGVEIAFLMKELDNNKFKMSFRSKNIDVNQICSKFNGGGHKYAAGCVIEKSQEETLKILLDTVEDFF